MWCEVFREQYQTVFLKCELIIRALSEVQSHKMSVEEAPFQHELCR